MINTVDTINFKELSVLTVLTVVITVWQFTKPERVGNLKVCGVFSSL